MTPQKYELDEGPPQQTKSEIELEKPTTKEEAMADVYDVYNMVSGVHSKITNMTRDYTLAKLNSDLVNGKFPKFIREQRKTLRIIKSFLIIPEEELCKRYDREVAKAIRKQIIEEYRHIQEILLGELDEMVILSRAGKGEITTGMLMHGRGKDEREDFQKELGNQGMKEKLLEKQN